VDYSTGFSGTENPINESASWKNGALDGTSWHNVQKTPGLAFGTDPGTVNFLDSNACLTGAWGVNQRARGYAYATNAIGGAATEEIELLLHWTINAGVITGYEFTIANHPPASADRYCQLNRWNGAVGDFTLLKDVPGPGLTTGDQILAIATGSPNPVLSLYINGSLVFTYDTATGNDGAAGGTPDSVFFTGGSPGIGFYNFTGGSGVNADYGWTSFDATDGFFFGDFVQGTSQEIGASGHSVAKAFASNVTQGDLLVVGTFMAGTTGTCTVTDTRGNSWSTIENCDQTTDGHEIFLSWAKAKDSGACTITSSVSGNADTGFMGIVIAEYAGPITSADQHTHAIGNSGTVNSGTTPATTIPDEVCIGIIGGENVSGNLPVGTNGYTTRTTVLNGGLFQAGLLDKVVRAIGTQTLTATIGTSQTWSAIIGTFGKPLPPPLSSVASAPNLNWTVFRQRVWEDK
jgi:hypothetical protein